MVSGRALVLVLERRLDLDNRQLALLLGKVLALVLERKLGQENHQSALEPQARSSQEPPARMSMHLVLHY